MAVFVVAKAVVFAHELIALNGAEAQGRAAVEAEVLDGDRVSIGCAENREALVEEASGERLRLHFAGEGDRIPVGRERQPVRFGKGAAARNPRGRFDVCVHA